MFARERAADQGKHLTDEELDALDDPHEDDKAKA
jgi:hypothetical protein